MLNSCVFYNATINIVLCLNMFTCNWEIRHSHNEFLTNEYNLPVKHHHFIISGSQDCHSKLYSCLNKFVLSAQIRFTDVSD